MKVIKWTVYVERNETKVCLYSGDTPSDRWSEEDVAQSEIVTIPRIIDSLKNMRKYLISKGYSV